ncbi:MAG: helix-turn-helix transcriptional regulator [Chitinophagaceae bacterium]|jgi:transcriptional regulator with XRE-family HTH domain|nr:helix-turn-helix transcriptional regulator [Chitinophagaceae bacterium]MCA6455408.1 helix-turn-helix transcriptional regulator [Chitinophagaceae bacterium]MCA6459040.1 helix-turn-helix transcriptional regulator [Chitinophagaceae bacterium]MCA6465570.1 helix-turn-helix transcriptional regulator [Chitinophagaceae bacterium]
MEQSLGSTIRNLRKSKGLLIREVAAALSLDAGLLSKIENNTRLPTREHVKQFQQFYKEKSNEILLQYLSDRLVYELSEETLGVKALHLAEEKLKYQKNNTTKST